MFNLLHILDLKLNLWIENKHKLASIRAMYRTQSELKFLTLSDILTKLKCKFNKPSNISNQTLRLLLRENGK